MVQPRVITAGMLAGCVLILTLMVSGAVTPGGIWAAPICVAASVLRDLQDAPVPMTFMAGPVALGLLGLSTISMVLALAFCIVVVRPEAGRVRLVISGLASGLTVFVLVWFVVLPWLDPVMLQLDPQIVALAHLAWGGTLSCILSRTPVVSQLRIYVAQHCFGCPEAQRLADVAAQRFPDLPVRVVDLEREPDAAPAGLVAVPTYVLDGKVVALGNPLESDLLQQIARSRQRRWRSKTVRAARPDARCSTVHTHK
jgi:hypothetical protein